MRLTNSAGDQTFPVPATAALLEHARLYFNDFNMKEDFKDCLLPLAPNKAARQILTQYRNLRHKAPKFAPWARPCRNNHSQVDPDAYADLLSAARAEDAGNIPISATESISKGGQEPKNREVA